MSRYNEPPTASEMQMMSDAEEPEQQEPAICKCGNEIFMNPGSIQVMLCQECQEKLIEQPLTCGKCGAKPLEGDEEGFKEHGLCPICYMHMLVDNQQPQVREATKEEQIAYNEGFEAGKHQQQMLSKMEAGHQPQDATAWHRTNDEERKQSEEQPAPEQLEIRDDRKYWDPIFDEVELEDQEPQSTKDPETIKRVEKFYKNRADQQPQGFEEWTKTRIGYGDEREIIGEYWWLFKACYGAAEDKYAELVDAAMEISIKGKEQLDTIYPNLEAALEKLGGK